MMSGLSVVQLLLVTLMMSAREAREIGGGNFLEDEQQWLSTVHQYSRTVKHWNRFRDVSFPPFTVRVSLKSVIVLYLQFSRTNNLTELQHCKGSLYF
ncbi:hypothetical protein PO909_012333 [Leuciscus waleckii]